MQHGKELGFKMLLNEHQIIQRNGSQLVVAGLTDLASMRSDAGYTNPDIDAALLGAPEDAPVILLDHQPRMGASNAKRGVDLQLSVHTHGGMIRGLDLLVANSNGVFVSGLYDLGGTQLYVNNGTALWPGFAIRIGRPSELTVITLKRD